MPIPVKVVVGGMMAIVVAAVAATTLAITYSVSAAAIHTSGTRLAGAMMDTVVAKVGNYQATAEHAMHDIQNMALASEYKIPMDDTSAAWWEKWDYPLRTQMITGDFDYSAVAVIMADGGLAVVGTFWIGNSYYGYALDARSLATTNYTTAKNFYFRNRTNNKDWDTATQGPLLFDPTKAKNGDQRIGGYYTVVALTGGKPICFWVSPGVDTYAVPTGDFVMYGSCLVVNSTGTILGTINIGRSLGNMAKFLNGVASTPSTQIFILDVNTQLVASTYPAPALQYYSPNTTGIKAGVNGCVSSLVQSPSAVERIGCRLPANLYPYGPLKSIASSDAAFLTASTRDSRYGELDGANYFYVSDRIPTRNLIYYFNLILFLPESDILGDIVAGRNIAIGVTVAVFVVAVFLTNLILHIVLSPLDEVTARMYRVANLDTTDDDDNASVSMDSPDEELQGAGPSMETKLTPSSLTEIRALQVAYETMDTAIKSFTRYVPKDVVKELVLTNQICEINMRPMICSMLFADIAGFTSICERVPPIQLSSLIRKYFERSSRVVMGHGGIIDKFIGDCIMAVWGAPVLVECHEIRSAMCARSLVLEAMNDPLKSAFAGAGETLAIRVGVATGEVLAGNMGSAARMNYTVIGDDVNLASRLESLNRQWGTSTLISETTATECEHHLVLRHVVTIAVVGKERPVEVYEVLGVIPDANTELVGAITNGSSENRTITEAKRDREREELGQQYLKDASGGHIQATFNAGQLLRRLLRKCPVSDAHIRCANAYTAAMANFEKGLFPDCLEQMRLLSVNTNKPDNMEVSIQRVMEACERYIREPPPTFNGTWKADEK